MSDADYDVQARGAIARAREFSQHWYRIEAIIPVEARIVWEEVRVRMQLQAQDVISHENPQVENGMIIELLAAEYLAGPQRQQGGEAE